MWEIRSGEKFQSQFDKLPLQIKKKFKKQVQNLIIDFYYPSLHIKKMGGSDVWEARIDLHYRFRFSTDRNIIVMHTIGMHDVGLGRK